MVRRVLPLSTATSYLDETRMEDGMRNYLSFLTLLTFSLFGNIPGALAQGEVCPAPLEEISPEFPFESKFVDVLDSTMHYIEAGEGDPILFIHGQPTFSYLWRNVIPFVAPHGRAIAVDLIGMGLSGKPDIPYRFADHSVYLEAFIEALALQNITLVIHDWGGNLGMRYARRHPHNVRAVALMETQIFDPPDIPFPQFEDLGEFGELLAAIKTPGLGEELILEQNIFVEVVLPTGVGTRVLTEAEMAFYRAPYPTPESRIPTLVWPREFPIDGQPADTAIEIVRNARWLQRSPIPKLLFYAEPGILIPPAFADYLAHNVRNLETRFIGPGIHYLQEQNPRAIGLGLADWLRRIAERRRNE